MACHSCSCQVTNKDSFEFHLNLKFVDNCLNCDTLGSHFSVTITKYLSDTTLVKRKRTVTVDNNNFKSKYSPELTEINYS